MSAATWALIFLPAVILSAVLGVVWFFVVRWYLRRDMRRRQR